MSSALARSTITLDDVEAPQLAPAMGVQSILTPLRAKPIYWPQGLALALYAALLAVAALNRMHPAPPAQEDAIELVMLPPPTPVAEPPPPPVEEPPPPVAEEPPPVPDEPPPPVAEQPVAPVEPKPVPKPPQPKPKVAEHKPVEKPHPPSPAPARPAASAPPANAVPSGYFNQVASRVAHAAQSHPIKGPGRVRLSDRHRAVGLCGHGDDFLIRPSRSRCGGEACAYRSVPRVRRIASCRCIRRHPLPVSHFLQLTYTYHPQVTPAS